MAFNTRSDVAKLAQIDPEFAKLLNESSPIPSTLRSFEQAVQLENRLPTQFPATATEFSFEVPLPNGRKSRSCIYKPSSRPSFPSPLFVFIHGGGFCLGNPTHVALSAKSVAEACGAVVVAPSYRLAPAHPFPAAPEDVWDVFKWLLQPDHTAFLGVDLSAGLIIGGVSAGANLAAVTAQRYVSERSRHEPPLTGVVLLIPYLLEPSLVPADKKDRWFSREQNSEAPVIDKSAMDYVIRSYKPDIRSPQFSPFNVEGAHVKMPPVYLQVCGMDPLRDDGLIYESVLRENGIKTKLDVYPGVPHGHAYVFPTLKISQKSNSDLVKGAGWLLGREILDKEVQQALEVAAAAVAVSSTLPP